MIKRSSHQIEPTSIFDLRYVSKFDKNRFGKSQRVSLSSFREGILQDTNKYEESFWKMFPSGESGDFSSVYFKGTGFN
jgi:hypothetical protein